MSIDCKIVILGESGVGKTCIMMRFNENKFMDDHLVTVGATHDTKELNINGRKIITKIWDTCGNEQFRSIARIFYKGADIILLVYDITNKKSFDEIKNYWYQQIIDNTDSVKVFVVMGNKNDLYEEEVVDEQEARNFAESIKAEYGKCSALNGIGIEDTINKAIESFLNIYLNNKIDNDQQKLNNDNLQHKKQSNCC